MRMLRRIQLDAARAITGQVRSSKVKAILAEARLLLLENSLQAISLLKADEWGTYSLLTKEYQALDSAYADHRGSNWCYTLFAQLTHPDLNLLFTPFPNPNRHYIMSFWTKPPQSLSLLIPVSELILITHQPTLSM